MCGKQRRDPRALSFFRLQDRALIQLDKPARMAAQEKRCLPARRGSVVRASACKPKGHGFSSGQGHIPGCRFIPQPCWARAGQPADVPLSPGCFSLCPSLPLCSSLSLPERKISVEKHPPVRINQKTKEEGAVSSCFIRKPKHSLAEQAQISCLCSPGFVSFMLESSAVLFIFLFK